MGYFIFVFVLGEQFKSTVIPGLIRNPVKQIVCLHYLDSNLLKLRGCFINLKLYLEMLSTGFRGKPGMTGYYFHISAHRFCGRAKTLNIYSIS